MKAKATSDRRRFKIVEFTNPSGATVWRVSGTAEDGERVRVNFPSRAEAEGERDRLESQTRNCAIATRLVSTRLTDEQAAEAERAIAMLPDGKSLCEAVRYFLDNYRAPVRQKSLDDAFAEFLTEKRNANAREDTIKSLRNKVGFLVSRHGRADVGEIAGERVREIIFRPGTSPVTRDNVRRALSSFFTWAKLQGYCAASPCDAIRPIKIEREEPTILPLGDVVKFLSAAAAHRSGALLPYCAIALFAAVRPRELSKLTWADVDLESKTLTIGAHVAKMRSRRVVELSDNLVEWLRPFALRRVPICGPNWRRDFDTVKAAAGYGGRAGADGSELKPWTVDVLRHTAISNHFAMHQHEGKTATWAGNSPDMIHRHYKGLVKPADAERFWQITPAPAKGKIVRLAA
jgi:integrase